MSITLDNRLPESVDAAWFCLDGVTVRDDSPALRAAIDARMTELRAQYPEPAAAAPVLSAARRFYRRLGIDPSRRRPASEALVRRVLQDKGLYTVNTAVDAANLASITHFLPVGLYDLDRVVPRHKTVTLRLGRPGEEFRGIRKGAIHVSGRPVLADGQGPFGNPSADSFRTRVTLETTRLFFVIYCGAGEPPNRLADSRRTSLRIMQEFVGGNDQ